jgi:uncharacterized membrane protein AbrB (regulator of aidB expression)
VWLAMLVRTFIGMVVQVFLVSTVIIPPALGVAFLKSTAFDKITGALEISGRGSVVVSISCQFTKNTNLVTFVNYMYR